MVVFLGSKEGLSATDLTQALANDPNVGCPNYGYLLYFLGVNPIARNFTRILNPNFDQAKTSINFTNTLTSSVS